MDACVRVHTSTGPLPHLGEPEPEPEPFECDPKMGPKRGDCPVAKCMPPPNQKCKIIKEYEKNDDTCCPKPCNFECEPDPEAEPEPETTEAPTDPCEPGVGECQEGDCKISKWNDTMRGNYFTGMSRYCCGS